MEDQQFLKYAYPEAKYDDRHFERDLEDADRIAVALGEMTIGKPATYGGEFLDKRNERLTYDPNTLSFSTIFPPDVPTKNARILALCGLTDNQASPLVDGWFLSDFLAFYHLFSTTAKSSEQTWMHALNFQNLLQQHKQYLHGNPYKKRKVVLDRNIYNRIKTSINRDRMKSAEHLADAFLKKLRAHCELAAKRDQPLLVLIFAHGELGDSGSMAAREGAQVRLGGRHSTINLSEFVSKLNVKTQITIMSTACYSGGWIVDNSLNASYLAAAGPGTVSTAWSWSASIRRACGSVYASAIINSLIGGDLLEDKGKGPFKDQQSIARSKTMAEFTRIVYETLLDDLDRRGWEHHISFRAQDDDWEKNWQARTGIPLETLKKTWDSLEDYPADPKLHPGDYRNRDPDVSMEKRNEFRCYLTQWRALENQRKLEAEGNKKVWSGTTKGKQKEDDEDGEDGYEAIGSYLGKRAYATMTNGGGTFASFRNGVLAKAELYFESNPGDDDLAPNGPLHSRLQSMQEGTDFPEEIWIETSHILDYRTNVMRVANVYIQQMGLSLPDEKSCEDFDYAKFHRRLTNAQHKTWVEILRFLQRNGIEILFPEQVVDPAHGFTKGWQYVVSAIFLSSFKKEQMEAKLKDLVALIKENVEPERQLVKEEGSVREKRQKVAEAYGKTLRDLSPVRQAQQSALAGLGGFENFRPGHAPSRSDPFVGSGSSNLFRRPTIRNDLFTPPQINPISYQDQPGPSSRGFSPVSQPQGPGNSPQYRTGNSPQLRSGNSPQLNPGTASPGGNQMMTTPRAGQGQGMSSPGSGGWGPPGYYPGSPSQVSPSGWGYRQPPAGFSGSPGGGGYSGSPGQSGGGPQRSTSGQQYGPSETPSRFQESSAEQGSPQQGGQGRGSSGGNTSGWNRGNRGGRGQGGY